MPSTSSSSAAVARRSAVSEPKRRASSFAARSPTWRMPRPASSRHNGRPFAASSCCPSFSAERSPHPGSSASRPESSDHSDAGSLASPSRRSCSMRLLPRPSMSIAARETKWRSRCRCTAGQARFGQRITTSPGSRVTAVAHDGHAAGIWKGGASVTRAPVSTATTLGMTSPPLATHTVSPSRTSRRATSSALCSVARDDRAPREPHRVELGDRRQRPGAPDLDDDVQNPRPHALRRVLERHRPARELRGRTQRPLLGQAVDLHHDTVDVEGERGSPLAPLDDELVHVEQRGAAPPAGVDREPPRREALQRLAVARQRRAVDAGDLVREEAQAPGGALARIEHADRAGGRVARVGERLLAFIDPSQVDLRERGPRHEHLAAHLQLHRRRREQRAGARGWCGRFR